MTKANPFFLAVVCAFGMGAVSHAAVLVCPPTVSLQGRVLSLGAKKGKSDDTQIKAFVQAYSGILEDSKEFIFPESLSAAYRDSMPFSIEGEGALFLQTQEALASLEFALEKLPPELRDKTFAALCESLKRFSPEEVEVKRKKIETKRAATGSAPIFTLAYRLPDAFPQNGVAGRYSADGKYLITANSQGVIQTYDTTARARKLVYSTQPFLKGNGWQVREGSIKVSPLALRPGGKQFAFLLNGAGDGSGPYLFNIANGHLENAFHYVGSTPGTSFAEKLTFSPDGRLLGIGGRGNGNYSMPVAVWDIEEKSLPVGFMQRFCGGISSDFSPDGRFYFNTGGSFHIHDLHEGAEILTALGRGESELDTHKGCRGIGYAEEMAVHPTKPFLALQWAGRGGVNLWSYDYSKLPKAYSNVTNDVSVVPGHLPRKNILYLRKGKAIEYVPFHTQRTPKWENSQGTRLLFSPDGNFLVSHVISESNARPRQNQQNTAPPSSLVIYKTHDFPKPTRVFKDLSGFVSWQVSKILFSPDGSHMLTLDYWGRLCAFSVPDFEFVAAVGGASAPIWDFDISPDSRRIFTLEGMGKPMERNFLPE